jgi:hypothetical protein
MAVKQPWQDFYNAQSGEYGDGYSGDLNKGDEQEYLEGDARAEAARAEFHKVQKDMPDPTGK